jgi:hypothetical protein
MHWQTQSFAFAYLLASNRIDKFGFLVVEAILGKSKSILQSFWWWRMIHQKVLYVQ